MSSFVIQRMFGLSAARMGEIEAGTRQNNATRILKVDFKNDRALAFGVGLMAGNFTRKSAQRSRGQTPCSFSCKATLAIGSHSARELTCHRFPWRGTLRRAWIEKPEILLVS